MPLSRYVLLIALALAGATSACPAFAQTKPAMLESGVARPASAIFIGNSFFYYNNSLHSHFLALLRAGEPGYAMRATSVTISGSGSDWHDVESYFRPNAIGKYSFDANNNIVMNTFNRLFDLAIMMDCSLCPVHPDFKTVFAEFTKKHSDTVRKHGAVPVFFMSWAYADKPEMTAQLAEAYTQAGNANRAFVVPVGLAFAKSVQQRPELNLYVADKRHPSLAGTYLSAATLYAALLKKSPVDLSYTAGLDAATAKHLQSVAWDTVQGYYGSAAATR